MIAKRIGAALLVAAGILLASASLRYAQGAGWLDAEGAKRAMQVLIGLGLAAYANLMPKQVGAVRSARAEARTQAALRVGGWSLTLAGLAYAGLWAFAPLPFADSASEAVVAAATAVTLGYAVWSLAACRWQGAASR